MMQESGNSPDNTTLDFDRRRRCGYPEVVYAEGKQIETLVEIVATLFARQKSVLSTRVNADQAAALMARFRDGSYNDVARTFRLGGPARTEEMRARVAIITAGTSDLPVAEEARETLEWMGVDVTMIHDVGVAGPHRLPERVSDFEQAEVVVVVAGMEGALPSVVAGYVSAPVIAVPTSVGYGANLGGVSALLSMLNSCASNVAVVNIDAGFKGGYMAGVIAQQAVSRSR